MGDRTDLGNIFRLFLENLYNRLNKLHLCDAYGITVLHCLHEVTTMNTVQSGQEKRTIKVKEFLEDFYSGANDDDLMTKYRLTPTGLEKFYEMLQEKGVLHPDELTTRYARDISAEDDWDSSDAERSSFICPSCLASQDAMFDICPNCGVSFQDLISGDRVDENDSWRDELLVPEVAMLPGDLDHAPSAEEVKLQQEESTLESPELSEDPAEDSEYFGPEPVSESGDLCPAQIAHEAPSAARFHSTSNFEAVEALACAEPASGFVDSFDDFDESDLPFAAEEEESPSVLRSTGRRCQTCEDEMQPGFRDIYDRERSHLALLGAGVCLVMALFGSVALSFFDGYSLGRLLVVYLTGMLLLFGSLLAGIGTFMRLAREKVYYCTECKSIYPRG